MEFTTNNKGTVLDQHINLRESGFDETLLLQNMATALLQFMRPLAEEYPVFQKDIPDLEFYIHECHSKKRAGLRFCIDNALKTFNIKIDWIWGIVTFQNGPSLAEEAAIILELLAPFVEGAITYVHNEEVFSHAVIKGKQQLNIWQLVHIFPLVDTHVYHDIQAHLKAMFETRKEAEDNE